jgi:hypothetical protein
VQQIIQDDQANDQARLQILKQPQQAQKKSHNIVILSSEES